MTIFQEVEEREVKLPSPMLSRGRPSVHFGDDTTICDVADDTRDILDNVENTSRATEDANNQTNVDNNLLTKKVSLMNNNNNNNCAPIIKVL